MPAKGRVTPLLDRLATKVLIGDECWEWIGARSDEGYGQIKIDGRARPAHRVFYELMVGPIPDGLQLDHLCRNRRCVRPHHVEPVTQRENILRGAGLAAQEARQTHCKHGHPFDERNTHWRRSGGRLCRTCNNRSSRESHARKRNERAT